MFLDILVFYWDIIMRIFALSLSPVIILFFYLSCTSPEKVVTDYEFTDWFEHTGTFRIPVTEEFAAGSVTHISQLNDSIYVFIDRQPPVAIMLYNIVNNELRKIGKQGDGPDEYRQLYYTTISNDGEISFSEGTGASLTILDTQGRLIDHITLPESGGTKFTFNQNSVVAQGRYYNHIYKYDRPTRELSGYFPMDQNIGSFLRRLRIASGGIAEKDDTIYWMNIVEPHIYSWDITSDSMTIITPNAWDMFSANHDRSLIGEASMNPEIGQRVIPQLTRFMDFEIFEHNDNSYFLVHYIYQNERVLQILDTKGIVHVNFDAHKPVAGLQKNKIHFIDLSRMEHEYDMVFSTYRFSPPIEIQ